MTALLGCKKRQRPRTYKTRRLKCSQKHNTLQDSSAEHAGSCSCDLFLFRVVRVFAVRSQLPVFSSPICSEARRFDTRIDHGFRGCHGSFSRTKQTWPAASGIVTPGGGPDRLQAEATVAS